MITAIKLLEDVVKEFEGCCLTAYPDPGTKADPWTIGWGATGKGIIKGVIWTQKQADDRLSNDLEKYLLSAITASPILKSQSENKKAAIADFIYNCGIGNYNSSTLKKKVDSAHWADAVEEIKKWNKGGGKVLQGLVIRRQKEADLLIK